MPAERLATANVASILGECDSALRRAKKGLVAIEAALAVLDGHPPTLTLASEVDESLRVRAAYMRFRRRIQEIERQRGEPGQTLYVTMRAVGTAIAVLSGREEYSLARVADRLQIRELQRRILAWLHPDQRHDELAGQRLWQDVVSFTEMLTMVNRRSELVEHDRVAIAALSHALESKDSPDSVLLEQLRALQGLHDPLDAVAAATPLDREYLTTWAALHAAHLG